MKKNLPYIVLALVLLAAGTASYLSSHKTVVGSLASVSESEGPWPAEVTHLKERLTAIHQPALAAEGNALHIHQHLDIFVHGKPLPVPPGIGIHETAPAFISPVHVHDTQGIIHVESPTVETFTLGQFFDIWGVRLSATCVGGYCTDGANTLVVYVNGEKYQGDPRHIELASHQEILIAYGTASEVPNPLPANFAFPQGY
jgi:hypothetical protein